MQLPQKTIKAQLPLRILHLARMELRKFCDDTEKWIENQEWRYDDNDNDRPLNDRCRHFVRDLINAKLPNIMTRELNACARYGHNLAHAIEFGRIDEILPGVSSDCGFWAKIGNFFAKTFSSFLSWFSGKSDDDREHERLLEQLEKFRNKIDVNLEKQKDKISRKVCEIIDGEKSDD